MSKIKIKNSLAYDILLNPGQIRMTPILSKMNEVGFTQLNVEVSNI